MENENIQTSVESLNYEKINKLEYVCNQLRKLYNDIK